MFQLKNKTAIVTGCNGGIGGAISLGLAKMGANILGVFYKMPEGVSEIEKKVKDLGVSFKAYECDLSKRESVHAFTKKVIAENNAIDILINNAGTILRNPAAQHSDAEWDTVIEINLNSQFVITREIGKKMLEQGSGKIIFTASLLSFQGGINVPSYTASKSAIGGIVKAFSNEWASKGINVNGIAPGYISTDNTTDLRNDPVRSKSILDRIPAGRWGQAEDLQGAAIFLASTASDYVSGTIITVDGGWMGR